MPSPLERQFITDAEGNRVGVILPMEQFRFVEQILEQRFPDSGKTEQMDENTLSPFDLHEPMFAYAGDDLIAAAQSSLDFWDNPFDDEDWNEA
jgi:hypothetical protein